MCTGYRDMNFLNMAMQPSVVSRALKVAAVVGTLLAAINHGGALLSGVFGLENAIQVGLTYLVPYGVSTYSSVGTLREGLK